MYEILLFLACISLTWSKEVVIDDKQAILSYVVNEDDQLHFSMCQGSTRLCPQRPADRDIKCSDYCTKELVTACPQTLTVTDFIHRAANYSTTRPVYLICREDGSFPGFLFSVVVVNEQAESVARESLVISLALFGGLLLAGLMCYYCRRCKWVGSESDQDNYYSAHDGVTQSNGEYHTAGFMFKD